MGTLLKVKVKRLKAVEHEGEVERGRE